MQVDSNYKELLQCFVDERVLFLIVGGYAVIKHSEPYLISGLEFDAAWARRDSLRRRS